MNEKLRQVHAKRLLGYAMILVLVSMGFYQIGRSTVGPGEQSEQWYTPEQEATYIIGPFNTTFFFAKNHTGYGFSAYEGYELLGTDDDGLIQYCINNTTTDGGLVFIKPGVYSASVTLKNNVRLVIEKGAATVTVAVNAGASCTVEDWNSETMMHYEAGVLTYLEDHANGNVNIVSLTVSGAALAGSFNSTTYYVGGTNVTGNMLTGGGAWQGAWNATVAELITNSAIAWGQITSANATVQQLITLYQDYNWQGTWNSTVSDIILNAAIGWSQITNANATVNQLISAASVAWSQIINANATVQQLVATYQDFSWQGAWNTSVTQLASYLTFLNATTWVNATNLSTNHLYLGSLTADPSPLTIGMMWYRSDLTTMRYYDGAVVDIPGIGGSGTTYILPFTYTFYKTNSTTYACEKYDGTVSTGTNISSLYHSALDTVGDTAGASYFFRAGTTYSWDTEVLWRNFTQIIGEDRATTIFRPSSSAVSCLLNFSRYISTATSDQRLQKCLVSNIQINMQDYAGSTCIAVYNTKDTVFEKLWLQGWKTNGVYMEGKYADAGNIWLHFRDIMCDATSTGSLFHAQALTDDIWISDVTGTLTGGSGFKGVQCNAFFISRMHLVKIAHLVWLAQSGQLNWINVYDCHADTFAQEAIYIVLDPAATMTNVHVDHCVFLLPDPPGNINYPAIRLVGTNTYGKLQRSSFTHNEGSGYYTYIATWDNLGTLDGVTFVGNMMKTGWTGTYANFTAINNASCYIADDYAYLGLVPQDPASYIVDVSGTTYRMVNQSTGFVDYSSTNASQTVAFAMGNLTSGRIWKEKVVMKGNFSNMDPFLIPSYTTLEIVGLLKAKANITCSGFVGSNGTTMVELMGGTVDGNPDNQNIDMDAIFFYQCQNFTIHDLVVSHGGRRIGSYHGEGIDIWDCDYGLVTSCQSYDSYYDCIKVRGSATFITVSNNRVSGSRTRYGIQIASTGTQFVDVVGNVGFGTGCSLHNDAASNVNFVGNVISEVDGNGLSMHEQAWDCVVSGNIFSISGSGCGISLWGTTPSSNRPNRNIITGNTILLSGTSSPVGIAVHNGDNNTIQNNVIKSSATNWGGIKLNWNAIILPGYCLENIVRFNNFWNTTVANPSWGYIKDNGTNTDIMQNFYNGKLSNNGYGYTMFMGGSSNDLSATAKEFMQMSGLGSTSAVGSELYRYEVMPCAGTFKVAYGYLYAAPGGTANRTFTFRVNADNSTLVLFFGSAVTTVNNLTLTVSVNAGDRVNWESDVGGTAVATKVALSVIFMPSDVPPP